MHQSRAIKWKQYWTTHFPYSLFPAAERSFLVSFVCSYFMGILGILQFMFMLGGNFPSWLFSCSDQTLTQSNLGFIWLLCHSPLLRDIEAGTWSGELKQRPWRNTAYRLAFPGSHSGSFVVQSRLTCLGMVPPTVGCALLY